MSEFIKIEKESGIQTLTMARAAKKNALTNEMYGVLADALEGAEADPTVRVILIKSEGEAFTAGNDIGDFAKIAAGRANTKQHAPRFLRALARASRPIVAAVQGRAVGVGTTMLLHCDIVILAEDALLSTPFVNLALVPEAASSLLMPLRIGYVRAFQMFALGDAVDAASAYAWGIANKVVSVESLHEEAGIIARRLAKQPLGSLGATKRLMRGTDALVGQMDAEGARFAERLKSAEAIEAFAAFAEKRPPDFSKVTS
jgi:enoyl-CoA hydratase/carnithine racemase